MTVDPLALTQVSLRRVPLASIGGSAVLSSVALAAASRSVDVTAELLPVARLTAVVIAASCSGAVIDPSAALTDSTWRGRLRRSALVMAPTMLLGVTMWTGALIAAQRFVPGRSLPLGGLIVELVAITLVCWTTTVLLARGHGARGAPLAGASCVMVLAIGTMSLSRTTEWLWRSPDHGWMASHGRWVLIGAAAAAGLAAVWRDPAR